MTTCRQPCAWPVTTALRPRMSTLRSRPWGRSLGQIVALRPAADRSPVTHRADLDRIRNFRGQSQPEGPIRETRVAADAVQPPRT